MKRFVRKLSTLVFVLMYILCIPVSAVAQASVKAEADNTESIKTVPGIYQVFKDLNTGNKNAVFINYLAKRGMIKGFPDGTFRPDQGLTRAEAVALLVNALHLSTENGNRYADVGVNHWAAASIAAAEKAGIITGYPDGTFRPDRTVTRAEGIAMLLRGSREPDTDSSLPRFVDLNPNHWAAKSIAVGLASEMVSPADNNHFLPDVPMSRGDLTRALSVLLTKDRTLSQADLPNKLIVLKGSVSVTNSEGTQVNVQNGSTELKAGARVRTGKDGLAELVFPDGSGVLVKESTNLLIRDMRGRNYIKGDASPGVAVEWLNLDLTEGRIFGTLATPFHPGTESRETEQAVAKVLSITPEAGSVNKTAVNIRPKTPVAQAAVPWWKAFSVKRVRIQVDMPWGVAAVRGTFWENEVVPGQYNKTTVLTGEAILTAGGQSIEIGRGQRSEIKAPGSSPIPSVSMSEADKNEWIQVKDWAQERAEEIQENQDGLVSGSSQVPAPNSSDEVLNNIREVYEQVEASSANGSAGGGGGSSVPIPVITSYTPTNNSAKVPINSEITINFNTTILPGTSGAYSSIRVTGNGSDVDISKEIQGNKLVITNAASWQYGTDYIVTIPANAVKNSAERYLQTPCSFTFTTRQLLAFNNAVNYSAGTSPRQVVSGYFNSDNVPDLVVADSSSPDITFLRGNGDGMLLATGTSTLSFTPRAIVTGDFNGDTKADLAAIGELPDNNLAILTGNGSGTFVTSAVYSISADPRAITAGDFNNDSVSDLAVTDGASGEVNIMTGHSDGTFTSMISVAAGSYPKAIITKDFNNDNNLDLATLNGSEQTVSILLGAGNGTFGAPSKTSIGLGAVSLAAGQFSGDSVNDIAVAYSMHDNNVSLLVGSGDGSTVAGMVYTTSGYLSGITVGDFNLDNKDDIAVASEMYSNVPILLGNGDGTLFSPVNLPAGTSPADIISVDLNGDAHLDLVVVNGSTDSNISVYINNT